MDSAQDCKTAVIRLIEAGGERPDGDWKTLVLHPLDEGACVCPFLCLNSHCHVACMFV